MAYAWGARNLFKTKVDGFGQRQRPLAKFSEPWLERFVRHSHWKPVGTWLRTARMSAMKKRSAGKLKSKKGRSLALKKASRAKLRPDPKTKKALEDSMTKSSTLRNDKGADATRRRTFQAFKRWLLTVKSFAEGSANDYAWSLGRGKATAKRRKIAHQAQPYFEKFTGSVAGIRIAEKCRAETVGTTQPIN